MFCVSFCHSGLRCLLILPWASLSTAPSILDPDPKTLSFPFTLLLSYFLSETMSQKPRQEAFLSVCSGCHPLHWNCGTPFFSHLTYLKAQSQLWPKKLKPEVHYWLWLELVTCSNKKKTRYWRLVEVACFRLLLSFASQSHPIFFMVQQCNGHQNMYPPDSAKKS